MRGSLTYQKQIDILGLSALEGEGDKVKLVSVSENIKAVAKCGSRDGANGNRSNVRRGC